MRFVTTWCSDYATQKFRGCFLVFGKRCLVFASCGRGSAGEKRGSEEGTIKKEAYKRGADNAPVPQAEQSVRRRETREGLSISLIRSPRRPSGFRNAKHLLLLIGQSTRLTPLRSPNPLLHPDTAHKQAPTDCSSLGGPNLEFWSLNLRDKNVRYICATDYENIHRYIKFVMRKLPKKN